MEYKFQEFHKKEARGNYYDGLNVQKKGVYFSKSATEQMGVPKKVRIFTDRENMVIKVIPSEEGFVVWSKPHYAIMINAKLHQAGMELGRYFFKGGKSNGKGAEYIFSKNY